MKIPLKITFRNMPSSAAIEDNIREKAAKLDSLFDDITSCRVIVEAPHRRHHKGKAYVVRIDITVPAFARGVVENTDAKVNGAVAHCRLPPSR